MFNFISKQILIYFHSSHFILSAFWHCKNTKHHQNIKSIHFPQHFTCLMKKISPLHILSFFTVICSFFLWLLGISWEPPTFTKEVPAVTRTGLSSSMREMLPFFVQQTLSPTWKHILFSRVLTEIRYEYKVLKSEPMKAKKYCQPSYIHKHTHIYRPSVCLAIVCMFVFTK